MQDEAEGDEADDERRADDGDNCQVEAAAEERLMLEDDSEGDPFDQDDNQPPDGNSLAAEGSHGGLSAERMIILLSAKGTFPTQHDNKEKHDM